MRRASVTSVTSVTALRGEMRGGHHSYATRADIPGHVRFFVAEMAESGFPRCIFKGRADLKSQIITDNGGR